MLVIWVDIHSSQLSKAALAPLMTHMHWVPPLLQGPNRSMIVTLECGLEEKLRDGSEPSKCVYATTLETPALCSAEERQELTKRLEELEELERNIAQQIKDEL